jgi:hypothetical protein
MRGGNLIYLFHFGLSCSFVFFFDKQENNRNKTTKQTKT